MRLEILEFSLGHGHWKNLHWYLDVWKKLHLHSVFLWLCRDSFTHKYAGRNTDTLKRFASYTCAFLPLQVNGKSYNQARLQLGRMGSLHPANRLAAYLTGRLSVDITHKSSQKPDSAHKISPAVTAKKTTGLKTPAQAPGKVLSLLLDYSLVSHTPELQLFKTTTS